MLGLWQAAVVSSLLWRAGVAYPNPTLTPGLLAATDGTTVCQLTVRAPDSTAQAAVLAEYGIPARDAKRYEIVGRYPRELGGSDLLANLWPQPRESAPSYRERQWVVAWFRREVCAGRYPLADAQQAMFGDWLQAYDRARQGFWP